MGSDRPNEEKEADHGDLLPPDVRHADSFLAWLCSDDADIEHTDRDASHHHHVLRNSTSLEEAATQTEQARVVPEQGHRC